MKYREEIHRYVQEHKDEIINTLGELVKIPSFQTEPKEGAPYGEACADILKYVQSCWEKDGFQTELYQENGYLLSYYGNGKKSIGLFSHADVVPVSDDWVLTEPFKMLEKDRCLIGRGVLDDKAAIVISLYCAKMLKELNIPINARLVIFTGVNEETGMKDIKDYVKTHTPPDFSIVTDCDFPVYRGDKGILQLIAKSNAPLKEVKDFYGGESMNITLGKAFARIGTKSFSETGISCHGALPEGSVNAGYLLSKRLCAEGTLCNEDLKQLTFISKLLKGYYGEVFGIENDDKTFGKLTCTNGMIGTDDGKPYLTFDIRYGLNSNDTHIKKKLKDFFTQNGWSVEITHEKKPFIISEDNVYLQKCLKAYKAFCETKEAPTYINAGATYAGELPCAIETGSNLYGGKPAGIPDGHGNAHQPDECITIEGFLDAIELITHMVLECDEVS